MPESVTPPVPDVATPDYAGLVRFLVQPFLENPDSLRIDCEISTARNKVLVRLAFESSDKGRVFGRGGRNIQAIRTVLAASAQLKGYTAHLEVFGASGNEGDESTSAPSGRGDRGRRSGGRGDRPQGHASPKPDTKSDGKSDSKPRPRPVPKGSAVAEPAPADDAPSAE
jgi:uncharacterized protein